TNSAAQVGVEYNSVRVELPAVQQALQAKVGRDANLILRGLVDAAKSGAIDPMNPTPVIIQRAAQTRDPFGHAYHAVAPAEQNGMIKLISAGPDETDGTPDDVSVDTYYGW